MMPRLIACAIIVLACATASAAQTQEPIGPFAIDVRGVSAGLPTAEGWTPAVPAGTVLPSRGLGIEVGGHVYVLRRRTMAVGIGATLLTGRGTSTPEGGEAGPPSLPDLSTRVRSLVPQLSLNFGHSLGWSYLSAGLGKTRVESAATLAGPQPASAERASGWVNTLNFGGGARWFLTDHVGIGFDLRWHKLSAVPADPVHPGAPRATLFVAGGGVVLK